MTTFPTLVQIDLQTVKHNTSFEGITRDDIERLKDLGFEEAEELLSTDKNRVWKAIEDIVSRFMKADTGDEATEDMH